MNDRKLLMYNAGQNGGERHNIDVVPMRSFPNCSQSVEIHLKPYNSLASWCLRKNQWDRAQTLFRRDLQFEIWLLHPNTWQMRKPPLSTNLFMFDLMIVAAILVAVFSPQNPPQGCHVTNLGWRIGRNPSQQNEIKLLGQPSSFKFETHPKVREMEMMDIFGYG